MLDAVIWPRSEAVEVARQLSLTVDGETERLRSIAVYILICGLFALGHGPDTWSQWTAFVQSPLGVILSVLIFAFAVVHTIMWLKAGPQSIRARYRKDIV